MSKSLGNFFLLREILGKFPGNVVRLFILGTHYRKPINFSMDNMEDSRKTLKNIITSMNNFSEIIGKFSGKVPHEGEVSDNTGNNSINEFKEKEYDNYLKKTKYVGVNKILKNSKEVYKRDGILKLNQIENYVSQINLKIKDS